MNNVPKAASSKAVPVVIVVLFLGCVGLASWAAQLWRNLVAAETEIARLRAHSAQAAPAEALQARNDALRAQVAELEAQRAAVPAPAPPAIPAGPAKPASFGALASEMMKTPAMREMMVRSQKTALERRFADLMDQLGLSPQDRTRFIDLLVEKQMYTVDIGLKMISGNQTAEDRAATAQQVKEMNAASDAKIRDFFGNDTASYATYQDYVVQQPLRAQVTALSASLATAGQPMSPGQSDALAGVMTEARKNFVFTRDFSDPANTDPQAVMNGPAMDTYFQEQEQLQNQIADRAAAFLSPEQVVALRQAQAGRLELAKKSMNMARQMMGSGK